MPVSIRRHAPRRRTISSWSASISSWPPLPSVWVSTSPTCVSSSTTTSRRASRATIRRRVVPDATAARASVSPSMPIKTCRSSRSSWKESPWLSRISVVNCCRRPPPMQSRVCVVAACYYIISARNTTRTTARTVTTACIPRRNAKARTPSSSCSRPFSPSRRTSARITLSTL